ncbi:ABC transporter substrate-binding protein [Streptomyces sp. NPDC046197]|uniref:ABC transporter substrate-binding protein n=1 Tax=Streptomyces sp. NPDC046197 TaxID=3154337 RepID=UPI0034002A1E
MTQSEPGGTVGGFNAALTSTVNPARETGGTLRFARTSGFDSLDAGNTYYAFAWNFLRLYGRSLVTFDLAPGRAGQRLVPDLAQTLGVTDDGGRTWTYRLRRDVRFEDGTPVTAYDVRHAIERSNFRPDVLGKGPTYFHHHLRTIDAVTTPDPYTLVFRPAEPFAAFDHLATLPSTVPVPRHRDTGADYHLRPVATGPYRVADYVPGERLVLLPNPCWDPATDPVRSRRAARIEVALGVDGQTVDDLLLSGETDIDLAGVGVQPATLEKIMADPVLRGRADNPHMGFTWMYAINPNVQPFDNIHCRRAVQYGTDKAAMQQAYGGPLAGDIAGTVLPPTLAGHEPSDRYPCGPDHHGDFARARAELAAAGRPDGFRTRIAARVDRLKEYAAAQALSTSLARVGIDAEVVPFQSGDYFEKYAGVPAYVHEQGLGIIMFGWGADFPDGFGFFDQILHGRSIKQSGNHNFAELDLPEINALLESGARTTDGEARTRTWTAVDRAVMETATICPYLHARSLLYRGPRATHAHVSGAYGMYDYAALGALPEPAAPKDRPVPGRPRPTGPSL